MAAQYSPSYAKNMIRRSLKGVHDPQPTPAEVSKLLDHFENRCAYCDVVLPAGKTRFHLDHLDSAGPNHASNRVPACATCNEAEKRELPWEPFLYDKSPSALIYVARRDRILAWATQAAGPKHAMPTGALRAIRLEEARALAAYDASLAAIREIVKSANAGPPASVGEDESLVFVWDLYEVVNACALRFDGYRYEALTGASLAWLANRFVDTRALSVEPNDNDATLFALQRYLFKWGGEQLPITSPEHRAYRALYRHLWSSDVPDAYRLSPYGDEWPAIYKEHAARVADALDGLDPTP